MRGYAYYSPLVDAPPGGLCLSAHVLVRQGGRFLVLRPKAHEAWKDWAPNWDVYDKATLAKQFTLWRLPAAYLREGEHPDACAARIARDQLGAAHHVLDGPRILSFHDPSSRFQGQKHWDLCFVYEAEATLPREPPAWVDAWHWARPGELRGEDFGSAIGDLVAALGMARE